MAELTYEFNDSNTVLETYEWDKTWIDSSNDDKTPRVLYIGDSISFGTRTIATAQSNGTLLFDGFATSKSLDNPFLQESIRLFARQQKTRKYIIFNNGLHGWHLDDKKDYPIYYEKMVNFIMNEFKDVQLFIVLTTYSTERTRRIKNRNKVAVEIANKYNLPVIDLYSVSKKIKKSERADSVHFTDEGYKILANTIIESISGLDNTQQKQRYSI